MSHSSFVYVDDGFGSQPDRCSAAAAAVIQRGELNSSGFLVNEYRSHWDPMQVGEWLGFVINTIAMTCHIPEAKVQKLKSLLSSAIRDRSYSYRELARIAGSVISVGLAVEPISRLFTRQMYLVIESRSVWDHTLHFSTALLEELRFWYCYIDWFNGYSLQPPPDSSTVIFSDTSEVGFGDFSASLDGVMASGMFTSENLGQSSTFRELKAIYYVLLSCAEQLKQRRVKVFTDNQGAARIVTVGSSKVLLQSVAMSIFDFCLSNGICLEAQWILRSQNEKADLLSRFVDKDD